MKKELIIIFMLVLTLGFIASLNCPRSPPKSFYGTVSHEGEPLQGDFIIKALMKEDVVGSGEVSGGEYYIDVSPCFGTTGEISFVINGVEANDVGKFLGEEDWGKEVNLDLSVNEIPAAEDTCGNGVIDLGEECDGINLGGRDPSNCGSGWTGTISCSSTCEIDYSNCQSGSSSSSSSSSGSGDNDGTDNNNIINLNYPKEDETNKTIYLNYGKNEERINPEITGGIIGFVKSGAGIGLIFAFIIIVLVIGVIAMTKNKTKAITKETKSPEDEK